MQSLQTVAFALALTLTFAACGDDSTSPGVGGPGTDFELNCFVRLAITSAATLSALDAELDFSRAPGRFVGIGHEVECERLDDRVAVYVNNCDGEGACSHGVSPRMVIQVQATHAVATPIDVTDCRFVGSSVPEASDFQIEVLGASDADLQTVDPLPVLAVTQIECRDAMATTTSTTVPDSCADVTCPDGEACRNGVCRVATAYEVDIALDTPVELGAFQFDVRYDCAQGSFIGDWDDVHCVPNPALNAYSSYNGYDCDEASGDGQLSIAVTSITGFAGPVTLATCEFESAMTPSPSQFTLEVVDASDRDLHPVAGTRAIIERIRPIAR